MPRGATACAPARRAGTGSSRRLRSRASRRTSRHSTTASESSSDRHAAGDTEPRDAAAVGPGPGPRSPRWGLRRLPRDLMLTTVRGRNGAPAFRVHQPLSEVPMHASSPLALLFVAALIPAQGRLFIAGVPSNLSLYLSSTPVVLDPAAGDAFFALMPFTNGQTSFPSAVFDPDLNMNSLYGSGNYLRCTMVATHWAYVTND